MLSSRECVTNAEGGIHKQCCTRDEGGPLGIVLEGQIPLEILKILNTTGYVSRESIKK